MKHVGLLAFIVCGATATWFVASGSLPVAAYVAIIGFSWLVGKSITHWHNPGELKISIWEDLGIVWKIRERADFVAAKAAEVEHLDKKLRELILKVLEMNLVAFVARNTFPAPPVAYHKLARLAEDLENLAISDPLDRDNFREKMKAITGEIEAGRKQQ